MVDFIDPQFFYLLSLCPTFLASYFRNDILSRLGFDNQVGSTNDHLHYLTSTTKDRSTIWAKLTLDLISFQGLRN